MNKQLERILKIVGDLTKEDLTLLNQTVSDLIKDHQKIEFTEAVKTLKKGDIVSCIDSSGIKFHAIVTKKTPKRFEIISPDNYQANFPLIDLNIEKKPSKKLIDFRKRIVPTREESKEVSKTEIENPTFH